MSLPRVGAPERLPQRSRSAGRQARPWRAQAVASCAVLAVLAHLLLAPVTLALTAAAVITGRVSRWRPHWLAVRAAAGATCPAAIGVLRAAAGYAMLPGRVAAYLGSPAHLPFPPAHLPFPLHGYPARLVHLPAAFSAPGSWLPRQLPLALVVAA